MPLTSGQADTRATAFCSAQGITDTAAVNHWKALFEAVYAGVLADLTVAVPAASIVTTGGPATQTGPAAPVPCTVA
jgi:hypothetical protein